MLFTITWTVTNSTITIIIIVIFICILNHLKGISENTNVGGGRRRTWSWGKPTTDHHWCRGRRLLLYTSHCSFEVDYLYIPKVANPVIDSWTNCISFNFNIRVQPYHILILANKVIPKYWDIMLFHPNHHIAPVKGKDRKMIHLATVHACYRGKRFSNNSIFQRKTLTEFFYWEQMIHPPGDQAVQFPSYWNLPLTLECPH